MSLTSDLRDQSFDEALNIFESIMIDSPSLREVNQKISVNDRFSELIKSMPGKDLYIFMRSACESIEKRGLNTNNNSIRYALFIKQICVDTGLFHKKEF